MRARRSSSRTCATFLRAHLSGYKLPRVAHRRRQGAAQRHRQGAVPAAKELALAGFAAKAATVDPTSV